jgi:hypothetical protein
MVNIEAAHMLAAITDRKAGFGSLVDALADATTGA